MVACGSAALTCGTSVLRFSPIGPRSSGCVAREVGYAEAPAQVQQAHGPGRVPRKFDGQRCRLDLRVGDDLGPQVL